MYTHVARDRAGEAVVTALQHPARNAQRLRDRVGSSVRLLNGKQCRPCVTLDGDRELVTAGVVGKFGEQLVDGARAVDLVHVDRHDAAADRRDRGNESFRTLGVVGKLDPHS